MQQLLAGFTQSKSFNGQMQYINKQTGQSATCEDLKSFLQQAIDDQRSPYGNIQETLLRPNFTSKHGPCYMGNAHWASVMQVRGIQVMPHHRPDLSESQDQWKCQYRNHDWWKPKYVCPTRLERLSNISSSATAKL